MNKFAVVLATVASLGLVIPAFAAGEKMPMQKMGKPNMTHGMVVHHHHYHHHHYAHRSQWPVGGAHRSSARAAQPPAADCPFCTPH